MSQTGEQLFIQYLGLGTGRQDRHQAYQLWQSLSNYEQSCWRYIVRHQYDPAKFWYDWSLIQGYHKIKKTNTWSDWFKHKLYGKPIDKLLASDDVLNQDYPAMKYVIGMVKLGYTLQSAYVIWFQHTKPLTRMSII